MKKNPKEAYGISQDGLSIRMVHLKKDGNDTLLLGMDFVELEKDWYKEEAVSDPESEQEFISGEEFDSLQDDFDFTDFSDLESAPQSSDDVLADFDTIKEEDILEGDEEEIVADPAIESAPLTTMFSKFPLGQGVIALNVHEQHILKDESGNVKKRDIKKFRKEQLSAAQRKAGQWQSCVVGSAQGPQSWLHTGPNLLLDAIQDFAKLSNTKVYYQLADANDLALTDFYRYSVGEEQSGTHLFVYLGKECRKAYVFEDGKWINSLPVFITQDYPDAAHIYSKLALAIDSAQISDPESIVLAGELVNGQLVDYMNSQSSSIEIKMMSYPGLVTQESENQEYQNEVLAPYVLALALAYKALNPRHSSFGKADFLPWRIVDSQKELRVVWHGFIVLSLIFLVVFFSTRKNMQFKGDLRVADLQKSSLTFTLNRLKAENVVIEQLSAEIMKYKDLTFEVVERLENKNRWTELFYILNKSFNNYRDSWISNLRQNGDKINISGVCSRRDYVSRLAESMPESRIVSVTRARIRNRDVWAFEMEFELPEVDWEDIIASEYVPLEIEDEVQRVASRSPGGYTISRTKKNQVSSATRKSYRYGILPRVREDNTPGPIEAELQSNPPLMEAYQNFTQAISKGNMLEYKFLAHVLLTQFPNSRIVPMVRWWTAYRMYVDRDLTQARFTLKQNLYGGDGYYPYSLLLDARISFALGEARFDQVY